MDDPTTTIRRATPRDLSIDRYLDRKGREVALIARCLDDSIDAQRPASIGAAIEDKFRLAAKLRALRSLQSWAITETARPEVERWRVGAYRFSFGYQRADLKVRGPAIYERQRTLSTRQQTFYTVSGMSAIATVVEALLRVHGDIEIAVPRGFYNETRELFASLGSRVSVAQFSQRQVASGSRPRTRILLVDSSASTRFDDYRCAPPRADLVLFDTTCFAQSSSRIGTVIDRALAQDLPVALVRSHAKLDSLGIEYGRLGSIVLLGPRSSTSCSSVESLRHAIDDAVRLHGVAALPAHFPPFSGTAEYRRLTRARTASIICSTRRMTRWLAGVLSPRSVRSFRHGLYLALVPDRDFALKDVKRLADDLCRALARQRLPVKHAGSFGFDFVAVEWFDDPLLRRNVIRVAGADLPASVVDRIAAGIERWWSSHRTSLKRPNDERAAEAANPSHALQGPYRAAFPHRRGDESAVKCGPRRGG